VDRRKLIIAFAVAGWLAVPSCKRPLRHDAADAGAPQTDGGPSVGDAPRGDVLVVDAAVFDAPAFDAPAFDARADVAADAPGDLGADAPPAVCPAGVAPLDDCGCGCCSAPTVRACYYPGLGESRDTIPIEPVPPPSVCATMGCWDGGKRYACCADPGPQPTDAIFCARNTSGEDLPIFTVTKRDAEACTTVQLGAGASVPFHVTPPPGYGAARGWRGPCGDAPPAVFAIGGLGSVTQRPAPAIDGSARYDVHVALFFDNGTGIADVSRIDVDDIGVPPTCAAQPCGYCTGACTFDTTYRYGFVGGNALYADTAIIAPPASFTHVRSPRTTMPADLTCAPPPPACGGPAIDVGDLMATFRDVDVQLAFTRSLGAGTTPFYGRDLRGTDAPAFQITRDGGGGFLVGGACGDYPSTAPCTEIPGGVVRLERLLVAFDRQELADASCAALRP